MNQLKNYIKILLLCVLLPACKDKKESNFNQTDFKEAAQEYCDCMKRNDSPNQGKYAFAVCRGELIQKYRIYKLYEVDENDSVLHSHISYKTGDTIGRFMQGFFDYTRVNCCKVALVNCVH